MQALFDEPDRKTREEESGPGATTAGESSPGEPVSGAAATPPSSPVRAPEEEPGPETTEKPDELDEEEGEKWGASSNILDPSVEQEPVRDDPQLLNLRIRIRLMEIFIK